MIQQISKEQYNLVLNNRSFFQNIKKVKRIEDKFYVTLINDVDNLQEYKILKNNNYYLSPKYKWVDVSYDHHNVIINPNNPDILGYSYSDGALSNKNKAVYEYFERLCCFAPQSLPHIKSQNIRIDYDMLGIDWSNLSLNGSPQHWINGHALFSNKTVEIPYNFIFYGKPLNDVDKYLGSSNGVALGKSHEDAFERAIREYIERDVLITCWLDKGNGLFKVKLDQSMEQIQFFLKHGISIDCYVYNRKIDNNFVIWCQLTNSKNKKAYQSSGFSAKPIIREAITHALSEAWGSLKYKEEKNLISDNRSNLTKIQDYYFDMSNANKTKILTKYVKEIDYSNLTNLPNISLKKKYKDIVSIDLSISELRNQGLYCQKVIGVGGKSMVFDYHLTPDMPKYLPLA